MTADPNLRNAATAPNIPLDTPPPDGQPSHEEFTPDFVTRVLPIARPANNQAAMLSFLSHKGSGLGSLLIAGIAVVLLVVATVFPLREGPAKSATPLGSLLLMTSVAPSGDQEAESLSSAAFESVLRVLHRSSNEGVSVMQGASGSPTSEGKKRKADSVLWIRGERRAGQFTINLEFWTMRDGKFLWREHVSGPVLDAAAVTAEASIALAKHVGTAEDRTPEAMFNRAAYNEYLRGRYFWNKRTPAALETAMQAFRAAIARDPKFALAYAGLAQTYAVADLHDPKYHGKASTYERGREAALQALAMDPDLAEAHAALAQILRNYDRNMPAAEREYRRALELDPSDATTHQWYAEFLSFNGEHGRAIAEIDRAHELDPLSAIITAVCGTIRMNAGRSDEANEFHEEALRLDPSLYPVYGDMSGVLEAKGDHLGAIRLQFKAAQMANNAEGMKAAQEDEAAYLRGGQSELLRRRLRSLLARSDLGFDAAMPIAALYCQLDDRSQCLSWLALAAQSRTEGALTIKINPVFRSVRGDAKFTDILRQIGLSPEADSFTPDTDKIALAATPRSRRGNFR